MPLNVASYIPNQFDANAQVSYNTDYVGSVQLLENSGFSPFSDSSPLNSTLTQIFDRFVQKTGLDTTSNKLTDEFLKENPTTQQAMDLYSAGNTFGSKSAGQQASIVLNTKIDDLLTERDADQNETLNLEESGFSQSIFDEVDTDQDLELTSDELKGNFYSNFSELDNVLNYFQSNRGVLVDTYG